MKKFMYNMFMSNTEKNSKNTGRMSQGYFLHAIISGDYKKV